MNSSVFAKERIVLAEDSGPGPNFKTAYHYIAAESGDAGSVIGREGAMILVAFHRTRLVVLVSEESISKNEA